jgi:hypothetical protein
MAYSVRSQWQKVFKITKLPIYPITNFPSVFNKSPMAFRTIAVRVVEEFFIIFGNHRPMFHAIYASACGAKEGRPEAFEVVERSGVGCRQACPKSKLGASGEHHALLPNETADADCATVFGKAVGMSSWQDLHHAGSLAAQRAAKHGSQG